jgi:hypothetical protein
MNRTKPVHISVIGAGSTYGIFLVKWAYQLLKNPGSNRENISLPPIGSISYSNTDKRNTDLVFDVLLADLGHMPGFEKITAAELTKSVRRYDRWREMVQKEKPDLTVVCSPTETHVGVLRELMTDFGVKNILCECPVAPLTDTDSLPGLLALAREKDAVVGVNLQYVSFLSFLKDLPLTPGKKDGLRVGHLADGITGMDITFITQGSRPWRRYGSIGEQIILEDLGLHALYFLPSEIRESPITVKKVVREGDNVFVNLVEYDLLFGKIPVRMTLGYRRKLKSVKMILNRGKQSYEFHVTGTKNPATGEYTRLIQGKNYAFPFRYALPTDLVKYSFMHALSGAPLVTLEEAARRENSLKRIYDGSLKLK